VAFWETGERTGSLDAAFARLAQRHAERFQHEIVLLSKRVPWIAYGLACALVVMQILAHGLAARPGF
jgi:type II secretory pathway component PulF